MSKMNPKYICSKCGKEHPELPDIGSEAPYHWEEKYKNAPDCYLDTDLCIIGNRDYFIRGVIIIPILKSDEYFGWGVWVSLKKENFFNYKENYTSDAIGPHFGWLSTWINCYKESTINLKTRAHFRGNALRPTIEIGPCDHELYVQQQEGISLETAWEIVHGYIK